MKIEEIYKIVPDENGWRLLPDGKSIRLGNRVSLGNWVLLGNWVSLGDRVSLGNWVSLGDRDEILPDSRAGAM